MSIVHLSPVEAWTFARLPIVLRDLDIEEPRVLHIGAHLGEEVDIYRACGFHRITLMEPDPRQVDYLVEKFGTDPRIMIIDAACGIMPGRATLHFAERTVWSGLKPHPTADGNSAEVLVLSLADIQLDDDNVLVIDTQGTELDILRTADLSTVKLVIIETSRRLNDTAAPYSDVSSYMSSQGWRLAEEWVHDASGYTDCLYVKA